MRTVRAFIDVTLGGLTGHVIPMERGEERDVPDDLAAQAVADGVCQYADAESTETDDSGMDAGGDQDAGDGQDGADGDQGLGTGPDGADPDAEQAEKVQKLLAAMQRTFEAGDPPDGSLRSDGSPKFKTLRDNGVDFPFTEADFDEAWAMYQEVNG